MVSQFNYDDQIIWIQYCSLLNWRKFRSRCSSVTIPVNWFFVTNVLGVSPGFKLCATFLNSVTNYLKTVRCIAVRLRLFFSIYKYCMWFHNPIMMIKSFWILGNVWVSLAVWQPRPYRAHILNKHCKRSAVRRVKLSTLATCKGNSSVNTDRFGIIRIKTT